MPEMPVATVKIRPDMSSFADELEAELGSTLSPTDGLRLLCNVVALLLIVCTPAIVWAVYGWAF